MPTPNGKQFQEHEEQDGPHCANCTDDMGEAIEWHDRLTLHPSKRVPCAGCGAV